MVFSQEGVIAVGFSCVSGGFNHALCVDGFLFFSPKWFPVWLFKTKTGDPPKRSFVSLPVYLLCGSVYTDGKRAVGQGWLKGIRIPPSAPTISNICFADDTILFSQATEQEAVVIRDILHRYAQVSGQIINMEKSTMLFSPNIRHETSSNIQQILSFQVVERFDKYLGLPADIGRSKVEIFGYLKDRLWARVKGWNEKTYLRLEMRY